MILCPVMAENREIDARAIVHRVLKMSPDLH
jgi:hypothetical protein